MSEMKDGDIYFWHWSDSAKDSDNRPYRSYHCCSQKAIVTNGVLYDTFWSDHSKPLPLDQIVTQFKGNINALDEIREGARPYYLDDDVVDMRHSNTSLAKIYVRSGAKRDPDTMLAHIKYQIERSKSDIRMAASRIEQLKDAAILIETGELDDVYL